MDAAQWPPQVIGVVEGSQRQQQIQVERRVRHHKEQALNCPRCSSTNTKFCYYNNYSLSQPRYFCKTCRRYWTEGGSLRNVPVGGGSRKNKRSSSSSSTSPTTPISSSAPTLTSSSAATIPLPSSSSAKFYQGGHDLNLSFPNQSMGGSLSPLEILRSGISARGLGPFGMPAAVPGTLFGAGFGFEELMRHGSNMKMQPLEGAGRGAGYGGSMQEGGEGRILFPFEDLKQVNLSNGGHESVMQGQGDPTLFWNGVMGNGGGNGSGGEGSW